MKYEWLKAGLVSLLIGTKIARSLRTEPERIVHHIVSGTDPSAPFYHVLAVWVFFLFGVCALILFCVLALIQWRKKHE